MRDSFVRTITALAESDPRIVLITGDLGFGVLSDFAERFPKQYLNAGVAEQNMTALACGMALEGRIVFTYSIANFPTLRCLEHLRNDICYHNAKVTVVSIGGGFSYGQLGMSHHATEDLAIIRALPNMTVIGPSDPWEAAEATIALIHRPGPAYLRIDKSVSGFEGHTGESFEIGRARLLRDGADITLIGVGGILSQALAAADQLSEYGIECRVLSMHTIKPLDSRAVLAAASETGGIITLEEHSIIGGLGGAVAEVCLEAGIFPGQFRRIGINDIYLDIVGDQQYLREYCGLTDAKVVETVLGLFGKGETVISS